jgi:hypothetical protein
MSNKSSILPPDPASQPDCFKGWAPAKPEFRDGPQWSPNLKADSIRGKPDDSRKISNAFDGF